LQLACFLQAFAQRVIRGAAAFFAFLPGVLERTMTTHHLITFLLSVAGAAAVLVVIYERRQRRSLLTILRRVLKRSSQYDPHDTD
jgi:hypothetical protein